MVPLFEAALARQCGASHAVAVNSATSALHVACLALGWVAAIGSGRVPIRSLHRPIAVCIAAPTSISLTSIQRHSIFVQMRSSTSSGVPSVTGGCRRCGAGAFRRRVVRYACDPCALAAVRLQDHRRRVSCGGRQLQGSGNRKLRVQRRDVLSFHPVKVITTAEGGMALTRDPRVASRMRCCALTASPAMKRR